MNADDDSLRLQPWFPDAVAAARIRAGCRVLQITAPNREQVAAVLQRIGPDGTLTVLEPDRYRAAAAGELEHPGLAVLGYEPEGGENFGVHDAVVAAPCALFDWPMNRWGALIRGNLRPGGRFAINLPGPRHCDQVRELWTEVDAPQEQLRGWNGPAGGELVKLLHADGLRSLDHALGTHLVEFPTAAEAAARIGDSLGATDTHRASLQLALARRSGRNIEIVLRFERLHVTGMR